MIDILPQQLEELKKTLKLHLKANTNVYAFGSRTNGKARKFSDLDLIIKGQQPLSIKEKIALQEDFAESDLNFRVDISDWFAISATFKAAIKDKLQLIMINK